MQQNNINYYQNPLPPRTSNYFLFEEFEQDFSNFNQGFPEFNTHKESTELQSLERCQKENSVESFNIEQVEKNAGVKQLVEKNVSRSILLN